MNAAHLPRRQAHGRPTLAGQRGAATLIIVMLLFFVVAMVAAYTSRNLIFEQRSSANQARSTQALEAAEAGVQWTLAMLNGGRIDESCNLTTDTTYSTFRARYIQTIDAYGSMVLNTRTGGLPLMPVCVYDAATVQWRCQCLIDGPAALPTVTSTEPKPMFRVRLVLLPSTQRQDVVNIVSVGCTRPDDSCLDADTPVAPPGDAMAVVTSMASLKSSLVTPPGAAVTARRDISGGAGPLQGTNTDRNSGGVTFRAGSGISGVNPVSLAGTPGSRSVLDDDPVLAGMADGGRMFAVVFGMSSSMYREQPGAVVIPCPGGCNAATVNGYARLNPGRPLWVEGDLTVDGDIGAPFTTSTPETETLFNSEVAPTGPVTLVVNGRATLTSGTLYGLLYARTDDWDRGSGTSAVVRGGLIAEGRLGGTGALSVVYDPQILSRLRTRHGTFVRVPGGWKDF
jgi:hypothetical protein